MKNLYSFHEFINENNITEEDIMRILYSRVNLIFHKYAESNDLDISTEEDMFFELEYFLRDELGISIDSNNLINFDTLDSKTRKIISDLPVAMYHFTSSMLVPSIKEYGLKSGIHKTNPHGNSYSGIYVTTQTSGKAIDGYKYHAVQKHGGDAVMITIKCYLNELVSDPDDVDIQSGAYQYIIKEVSPDRIIEIETVY